MASPLWSYTWTRFSTVCPVSASYLGAPTKGVQLRGRKEVKKRKGKKERERRVQGGCGGVSAPFQAAPPPRARREGRRGRRTHSGTSARATSRSRVTSWWCISCKGGGGLEKDRRGGGEGWKRAWREATGAAGVRGSASRLHGDRQLVANYLERQLLVPHGRVAVVWGPFAGASEQRGTKAHGPGRRAATGAQARRRRRRPRPAGATHGEPSSFGLCTDETGGRRRGGASARAVGAGTRLGQAPARAAAAAAAPDALAVVEVDLTVHDDVTDEAAVLATLALQHRDVENARHGGRRGRGLVTGAVGRDVLSRVC